MNRKTIAAWFLLAFTTVALAATFDYNPPPLGSSEVEKRNDLNLELDGINSTKAPIASPTFTGTVAGITKSMVGLGNVDNTSDVDKPVSTATQTALDLKETVVNVALKAPIASPTFTGTVGGITKSMVGLGNVDNTSDANKPVSTATQTALDLKANLASPNLTGVPTAPNAAAATNTTQLATTAFVTTADNLKANLAGPTFTGDPKVPTATLGDNDTSIASTAFVIANLPAAPTPITLVAEQASTSGTAITFGSIPAGTKRITVMFDNVSFAGGGGPTMLCQLGDAGGIETTGYDSSALRTTDVPVTSYASSSTGFNLILTAAASTPTNSGQLILNRQDSAHTWTASWTMRGNGGGGNTASVQTGTGVKQLSAELTQLVINGATFDAGSISISYE